MKRVVLLLGSNLGNKIHNIEKAFNEIEKYIGIISKKTRLLETTPWGFNSSNFFLNCAIEILTNYSPIQILKIIQEIEFRFGRINNENKSYEDRIIDIDLVFYENIYFWSKNLVIPHYLHSNIRNFSKQLLNELKS